MPKYDFYTELSPGLKVELAELKDLGAEISELDIPAAGPHNSRQRLVFTAGYFETDNERLAKALLKVPGVTPGAWAKPKPPEPEPEPEPATKRRK